MTAARGRREPSSLYARAVALLARREHSRAELAAKLKRKLGPTDDVAELERVLDALARDRLLCDERYAGMLSRTRAARHGDARIRHELKSAGVDAETIGRAVAVLKGTELERARALWSRRFKELPGSAQERGRQARFLQARGFSSETIRKILRGLPDED
jgi:regulatory protein